MLPRLAPGACRGARSARDLRRSNWSAKGSGLRGGCVRAVYLCAASNSARHRQRLQSRPVEQTQAGESRLLAKYLKPDLLIIDDMGLKVLPVKSGEILLEIIMRRYENRSTLMTSNRPIEEWGKLLSDVPAA